MSMKLLLSEDVEGLGQMGEMITVAEGYGRNYLLPHGLAVALSESNRVAIEKEKETRAKRRVEELAGMKQIAERIQGTDITLRERVSSGEDLYGAVTPKTILQALADEDINIDASQLVIEEPIKTIGVHRVVVRLHKDVETELKIWVVEAKDGEAQQNS